MNIEEKIFGKTRIDISRLISYGFERNENIYSYKQKLTDDFTMWVIFDETLKVKVIDEQLNEEYLNYRYSNPGGFAGEIASKIEEVLIDMRDYICVSLNYQSNQANTLDDYMSAVYGKAEFPFKDYPEYGVYKDSGDKWYAIIMRISSSKLDKNLPEDEMVEIINLKVDKKNLNSLIKKRGFYPAYHMNKQNWVSIILDDSVDTNELILLINDSYDLVEKGKNEKKFYYKKY